MMEAVLSVEMPHNWVHHIVEKYRSEVRILDCVPSKNGGGRSFFEIKTKENDLDAIAADIGSSPDVSRVELQRTGEGRIGGSLETVRCSACRVINESDCFLRSARSLKDGALEWTVITATDGALSKMTKKLKGMGCGVKVVRLNRLEDVDVLTERQEEVIREAFDRGYFDYPRRITIRELAKRFGVSTSTLGEILQRGERNIVESYLKKGLR